MPNKAEKPAWRERYEENNPIVSFRVSREEKDYLDRIRTETGRSFADMVKAGAGLLSKEEMKTIKRLALTEAPLGVCYLCGEPIHWDLTNGEILVNLDKILRKQKLRHFSEVPLPR
jgi:hypothetical protein